VTSSRSTDHSSNVDATRMRILLLVVVDFMVIVCV
jgi:hypothetical protein